MSDWNLTFTSGEHDKRGVGGVFDGTTVLWELRTRSNIRTSTIEAGWFKSVHFNSCVCATLRSVVIELG